MLKKFFLSLLLLFFMGVLQTAIAAPQDIYSFDSPKQQLRFQHLSKQFRCLVCQNETLADSNAPLAKDLRFQIYKMVKQNKNNHEITQFLVNRYGDFVLFQPRVGYLTFILWFGPFIMLAAALIRLYWLLNRRKQNNIKTKTHRFTKQDRERIRHLLQEY